jgi:hypothetical protein
MPTCAWKFRIFNHILSAGVSYLSLATLKNQ